METRFYVTLSNAKDGQPLKAIIEMPNREEELRRAIQYVSNGGRDGVSIEDVETPRALEFIASLVAPEGSDAVIHHLNAIASLCSDLNSIEAIGLYARGNKDITMEQLANVLMQAERIPFHAYSDGGYPVVSEIYKPEVLYGYMQTHPAGIEGLLRETDFVEHLHYAAIGRDAVSRGDVLLGESGYLDNTLPRNIRLDAYDWEAIYKAADLNLNEPALDIPKNREQSKAQGPRRRQSR